MTIQEYIHSIRNAAKRTYAESYAKFLDAGEPEGQEPARDKLSYMGAQAVRLSLRTFRADAAHLDKHPYIR